MTVRNSRQSRLPALLAGLFVCCLVLPAGAANRHALIVAVREYPDSLHMRALPGANRDAERLREVLSTAGFADKNIHLVFDDAVDVQNKPSRQNILRSFETLIQTAEPDDLVFVITTGHGKLVGKESYFCPADATDQSLESPEVAERELISIRGLTTRLSKCRARRKMLVVDACRDSRSKGLVRRLQNVPEGVWLMNSCSEGQFSVFSKLLEAGVGHAVFSYFLCEGLRGEADILGNNDGDISVFELYTYAYTRTQKEASRNRETQTPELFGAAAPFVVAKAKLGGLARRIRSGDPDVERRMAAKMLAARGNAIIQQAEAEFHAAYDRMTQTGVEDPAAYQRHHDKVCYAMGSYLAAALEMDPENREARLARAWAYRASGMYDQALTEYGLADEVFNLYVKGGEQALADWDGNTAMAVGTVPLRIESEVVAKVPVQSRVRISKVHRNAAGSVAFLYATAVDDKPLDRGGWIDRRHVHWFAEADDWYTPSTPMTSPAGRLPAALTRLDNASAGLDRLAVGLERPAEIVGQVRDGFANRPAGRLIGQFVPIGGVIGQVESAIRIPSGYVRSINSHVQRVSSYAGFANSYQSGLQRGGYVSAQRAKLIEAKSLDPVEEKTITIAKTPWQTANLRAAPADPERNPHRTN